MKVKYDRHAVKRLRARAGLTRLQVAQRAGITERTVYYVERGFSEPRASTLAGLAVALDVSVDAFFVRRKQAA